MRIRRHLSYANVTATVALFVALGGGAYAVTSVDSRDIANDSVKSIDLKDRKAVTGIDVKRNRLTGRQISEATLNAEQLAPVAGDETVDCNPSSTTAFTNCATARLHLRSRSRVLVIATGNQESVGGPAGPFARSGSTATLSPWQRTRGGDQRQHLRVCHKWLREDSGDRRGSRGPPHGRIGVQGTDW